MKLVEILARGLDEWPDHVAAMAQDDDGDVQNYSGIESIFNHGGLWSGSDRIALDYSMRDAVIATDHSTAIITRADGEAERARIKGEKKVKPKANEDGPLQWRDRIFELDAEQKAADDAHKAATEARDAERADLVAKLKAEGFALIQSDEPNGAVESAQQEIAQQDMSDPANWKVGDLIEVIGPENSGY